MASTTGALRSVENRRVAHAHWSTLPAEAAPLAPVIDSGAVEEEVAEDEAMAEAATFETEIEIATATNETASAIFETIAMDHPSAEMSIATTVIVGTVSSIHEQIA